MTKDPGKDPSYLIILNLILKMGKGYPDKLAYKLGISRQAVEYRLKKLIEFGYIEKKRNDKIYYILTNRGYEILKAGSKKSDFLRSQKRKIIKYIPLLGLSMGLITLGQHIVVGDIVRGFLGFISWITIGLIIFLILNSKL